MIKVTIKNGLGKMYGYKSLQVKKNENAVSGSPIEWRNNGASINLNVNENEVLELGMAPSDDSDPLPPLKLNPDRGVSILADGSGKNWQLKFTTLRGQGNRVLARDGEPEKTNVTVGPDDPTFHEPILMRVALVASTTAIVSLLAPYIKALSPVAWGVLTALAGLIGIVSYIIVSKTNTPSGEIDNADLPKQ